MVHRICEEKSPFSDAAKIAIQWGTREIIRPDWRKVFEPHVLRDAIHAMLPHRQQLTGHSLSRAVDPADWAPHRPGNRTVRQHIFRP